MEGMSAADAAGHREVLAASILLCPAWLLKYLTNRKEHVIFSRADGCMQAGLALKKVSLLCVNRDTGDA